ncbi:TPA: chaperone modulator CbpM [Salmonella enterica subsp. enterica serovar Goldcoast]|nr:chaperone modulator CbpM [Salmonella enterica subsp. enterica serovar Goldcoast]HBJ8417387.1 chaperone modulator CbpM [Salmonella enterica subsp. enterica serovar Goldcoast]
MANITVTFTITEFCLHTGVTEEELNEIVGLGVIEPYEDDNPDWQFDDRAASVVQRALRLREELALDWPGIAVALTLLEENSRLREENRLLLQRLSRFISHP